MVGPAFNGNPPGAWGTRGPTPRSTLTRYGRAGQGYEDDPRQEDMTRYSFQFFQFSQFLKLVDHIPLSL
jgi:hypothetical protein